MASIRDCAKSLSYLRPLKEGGYIPNATMIVSWAGFAEI
jgi:hypothetical protein